MLARTILAVGLLATSVLFAGIAATGFVGELVPVYVALVSVVVAAASCSRAVSLLRCPPRGVMNHE